MAKLSSIASLALAAGTYDIRIEEVELGEAKASGKPKLTFKGRVIGGEQANREVYISRSLQPQALFKLGGDLIKAGVDKDADIDVDNSEELSALLEEMVGKTYVYEVKETEYGGKATNDFSLVEPCTDADRLTLEGSSGV